MHLGDTSNSLKVTVFTAPPPIIAIYVKEESLTERVFGLQIISN